MATDPLSILAGQGATFRRIPSSVFRVGYVGLEEPVAVTSMGRVIAFYIPVGPAPRPAQHPDHSGASAAAVVTADSGAAGRSEAPGLAAGASTSESSSTPKASRRRASRARSSVSPVPTMTQAQRDKVLRGVNRSGSER